MRAARLPGEEAEEAVVDVVAHIRLEHRVCGPPDATLPAPPAHSPPALPASVPSARRRTPRLSSLPRIRHPLRRGRASARRAARQRTSRARARGSVAFPGSPPAETAARGARSSSRAEPGARRSPRLAGRVVAPAASSWRRRRGAWSLAATERGIGGRGGGGVEGLTLLGVDQDDDDGEDDHNCRTLGIRHDCQRVRLRNSSPRGVCPAASRLKK